MRLSEDKIKQAILHPEDYIRETALRYFARCYSRDETLMPLAIRAVEQYGRPAGVEILRIADDFVQTPATIEWLQEQLRRECDLEDVAEDNFCTAAALVLCRAPPEMLEKGMAYLPNFPEELEEPFIERLEMRAWDWEELWDKLEDLADDIRDADDFLTGYFHRGDRIVEAMARHADRADEVLACVHRNYRGKNKRMLDCVEHCLVDVAGRMHLNAAVPILVERLHEDNWTVTNAAGFALARIAGDDVIAELRRHWPDGNSDFRWSAAEILGNLRSDLAVQTIFDLLPTEEDHGVRCFLTNAALDSFAFNAIEPARALVSGDWGRLDANESDVRSALVAAATIMEVRFPAYDEWYRNAVDEVWQVWPIDDVRIRENFGEEDQAPEDWEDEDEHDWEREREGEHGPARPYRRPSDAIADDEPQEPVRNERPRVGRNAPCPCGSGKKYKKCCLKKESKESSDL